MSDHLFRFPLFFLFYLLGLKWSGIELNSYQIIRNQIKNWRAAKDGIKKIVWLGIASKWRSTPVQAAHAASSQLCSWFVFLWGSNPGIWFSLHDGSCRRQVNNMSPVVNFYFSSSLPSPPDLEKIGENIVAVHIVLGDGLWELVFLYNSAKYMNLAIFMVRDTCYGLIWTPRLHIFFFI